MTVTDRGEIMHGAGARDLSPALRDGAPVLVGHGDVAGRCGWAPFFEALEARGTAVDLEPEGRGARLVPVGAASPPAHRGPGGLRVARAFVEALQGRLPRR